MAHYAGWWGHRKDDRFKMRADFQRSKGAWGFQLSNPPVLQMASLRASLDVFAEAGGVQRLREEKAVALTAFLEACLLARIGRDVLTILTPADPEQRGCQLSIVFAQPIVKDVYAILQREAVIIDVREPCGMRVAPTPLYNTAADACGFVDALESALRELKVL
jgi:kynureninase